MKLLKNRSLGFTLVELLVVIAILAILVSIGLVAFRNSQSRGRDAERKSDLKQVASALELYYSDYGKYPDEAGGQIASCTVDPCVWGSGEFTDGKTIYFKVLPKDPSGFNYVYKIVDSPNNQKFQLFAHLENTKDAQCIVPNDCTSSPVSYTCGSNAENCNFSITSTNTTPEE